MVHGAEMISLHQKTVPISPQYFSVGPTSCNATSIPTQILENGLETFLSSPLEQHLKDYDFFKLKIKVNNVSILHQTSKGAKRRPHHYRYLRTQKYSLKDKIPRRLSADEEKLFEVEITGWAYFQSNFPSTEHIDSVIEATFEKDFDELLHIIKEVEHMNVQENRRCFSKVYSTINNPFSIKVVPSYITEPMSIDIIERSKARRELAYLLYAIGSALAAVLIVYALLVIWRVPNTPIFDPSFTQRPSMASIERDESRYFSDFHQEIQMFHSETETLSEDAEDENEAVFSMEREDIQKQNSIMSENEFVSTSNETLKMSESKKFKNLEFIDGESDSSDSLSKENEIKYDEDKNDVNQDVLDDIIDEYGNSGVDPSEEHSISLSSDSSNDSIGSHEEKIGKNLNKKKSSFKSDATPDTRSSDASTITYESGHNQLSFHESETDSDDDHGIESSMEAHIISRKDRRQQNRITSRLNETDLMSEESHKIETQDQDRGESSTIPLEEFVKASVCCAKFDRLKNGRNKKSLAMQDSMQEESLPWNHSTTRGDLSVVDKLEEESLTLSSGQSKGKNSPVDESLRATAKMSNSSSKIIEQNLSHLFSEASSGSLSSSSEPPWYDSILKLSYKWNPESDNGSSKLSFAASDDNESKPDLKGQASPLNSKYFQIPFSSSNESSKIQTMSEVDITSTSATTYGNPSRTQHLEKVHSDEIFMDMTADERRRYRDSLDELFDDRFQMDIEQLKRPGLLRDLSKKITTEEREEETRRKLQDLRRRLVE